MAALAQQGRAVVEDTVRAALEMIHAPLHMGVALLLTRITGVVGRLIPSNDRVCVEQKTL
ncbi:hypothetical protein Q4610_21010 [Sphingobium sp. HBC34]|uniref:Uncharacterized protein n=1 Tax=Sphingobium cyanobacteriorum TaxID=3063954 RepID=A0ABT8ZSK8_9SPHN|nr:hypothetical protein [Sphingobium sp. HBC34]MDO7837524.1 hypothetical protein [Sphingobium sp. HBC34]